MPYIPLWFEKELNKLIIILNKNNSNLKNYFAFNKFSEKILAKKLSNNDKLLMINNLAKINLLNYKNEVLELFNSDLNHIVKACLIEICKQQKLPWNIIIEIDHNQFKIDLKNYESFYLSKTFAKDSSLIEKYFSDNEEILDFAFMILENAYLGMVFKDEELSLETMAPAVIYLTLKTFSQTNELNEFLKKSDFLMNLEKKVKYLIKNCF